MRFELPLTQRYPATKYAGLLWHAALDPVFVLKQEIEKDGGRDDQVIRSCKGTGTDVPVPWNGLIGACSVPGDGSAYAP